MSLWCVLEWGRRSGQSVTASDFGSNGPRFESGRGRCVESLDKALYSHCPKEKAFTLASISYLAVLVIKYILAKKKKRKKMLCWLVHIKHSFWKGGHTFLSDWLWTTCIWYGCLFFSPPFSFFLLFLLSNKLQNKKKENSIEVWTMDVQLLRIKFSFEKKSMQISTLFWASLSFLGKMVIFAGR